MSKEEIKQEYKEQEGDPHLKGERKHLQTKLLQEAAQSEFLTQKR